MLKEYPSLMQRVCTVYIQDYLCLGFPLPAECEGGRELEWLKSGGVQAVVLLLLLAAPMGLARTRRCPCMRLQRAEVSTAAMAVEVSAKARRRASRVEDEPALRPIERVI